MAWKKRNASLLIVIMLCACLSILFDKPLVPSIQGSTVVYGNNFDSGSDWNSWMMGEPDITKIVPGEGNLGVVDGRLRRTGDKYLYYLGAESPHIPVSGTYQEFVVRFSWHAHSDYSGPQITNMEWGFWRSDGVWSEVEVLCYGGGTDLYGTVDKDVSSDLNDAIMDGCTWITIGFCFNDGRSDDWNQYVEIDDITATTTSGTSRTTAASATTVTRSTTITLWTTATAPLTTSIITTTLTATPPVATRSITITVTGAPTTPTITTTVTVIPPITTPTMMTTETAIPPVATVTTTTTVTATLSVTSPNITTATVTTGESTVSQTVTYTTYATHTMTTTATVVSSLTVRTIGGTVRSATPFYSGVLVGVLAALIIVFGLFFLMRTKGKFRVPRFRLPKLRVPKIQSKPSKSDVHAEPIYKTLDDRVLEYIMSNKGTISVAKASQDLGVEADFIKDAIQRLQRDGKLERM